MNSTAHAIMQFMHRQAKFAVWTLLFVIVSIAPGWSQTITRAEYFFDSDPGAGNATALAITPGATISQTYDLNTSALATGFHTFNARVRDNSGKWSLFTTRTFYLMSTVGLTANLVKLEYFVGADPGIGQATPISIAAAPTINNLFILNLPALTPGNYTLKIRAKDSNGFWSPATTSAFSVASCTTPAPPTVTPGSRCGDGTVTLNASGATGGQVYRWYADASTTTILNTGSPLTTPSLSASATFFVSILDSGPCESSRTAVTATINPIPAAPTTSGASRCGLGSVTLTATGGTVGQYRWYTVATGGTAIAGETNASFTTPSLSANTGYFVAINDGTCESNRTLVTATINSIPVAPTTTGASRCGTGSVTLNAAGGTTGQYRWYSVSTGGTPIAGETNATYATPALSVNTDFFVAINNGSCESTRTMVTATITNAPPAPTTTGASICGGGAVTLTASGGSPGQYRWYTVATGGTAITGQTNASFVTPSISTTTNYFVSIDNGTCESTRTPVIATINSLPTAPTTTGANICGSGTVTLNASGGSAGQYRWNTAATGGTALSGQTNSSFTTPSLSTTTTYFVSIDNGTCESVRTSVTATINNVPSPPTTTGASICGSGTLTLTAAGGSAGQYRWYTVATGGTAIAGQTNASFVTPSISATTTYYVSIDNGACESSRAPVVATIPGPCTQPPVISSVPLATQVEGIVTLNLIPLITTINNNLDVSSVQIVTPPASGAPATISNGILTINYKGIVFSGNETLTIRACDLGANCAQQQFTIEVAGEVVVYNAVSPNGDGKNEFLVLQYIESISPKNKVSIFNRWGDEVFSISDYDNKARVFAGLGTSGSKLPAGTYFYRIRLVETGKIMTGFISLKH